MSLSKVVLTALFVAAAAALPMIPAPTLAADKAPLGFQLLCLQQPKMCRGGGASVIEASGKLLDQLAAVNDSVNHRIRPHADENGDVWSVNVTEGDCEDYAMTKRSVLMARGVAPSALRIAYMKTRSGVGHVVLVVKTTSGDFVLDNLNPTLRPLSRSGYRMVAMSTANPLKWV